MMKYWRCVVFVVTIGSVPACSLMIRLQFDGSLRKPTDVGAPTAMLGQMAACACSVSLINDFSECPSLLGGKLLSLKSSMTSGEVEYEGLLFGLQSLRTYIAEHVTITNSKCWDILVQGDCKNVMNQMSGRAVPRKLENYHQVADAAVHSIEKLLSLTGSTCTFRFEHIPRTSNVVCDRTSARIIVEQQRKALEDVWKELSSLDNPNGADTRDVEDLLGRWFRVGRSLIPLTMRPKLYQRMASMALAMQDFTGLLILSQHYVGDIRVLQKSNSSRRHFNMTADYGNLSYGAEIADAVLYQIAALKALGRLKESVRVEQKNRMLLQKYPRNIVDVELRHPASIPSISEFGESRTTTTDGLDWPSPVLRWKKEAFGSPIWHGSYEYISRQ
jgi:ribonuclease HI